MKLKIPKSFEINKWLEKLEVPARAIIWPFVMILAVLTVVPNISNLTEFIGLVLVIYLIIFFIATTVVFLIDVRPLSRKQAKTPSENIGVSANTERLGRNKWISIGLLVLVVIVSSLIFVARQLPATTQGYQAFFTAFAAIAALGTGIALAVLAYQQYKLRQTEHGLLFEPQILLRSAGSPITGELRYNNQKYPYRIEWTVLIHNTSRIPVPIEFMEVEVRCWGEDSGKKLYLSPAYCYILEPEGLQPPFQFILTEPQRIRWIIEGPDVGHELDYVSGDSGNRRFELIFRIYATIPQGPSVPIIKELVSNPFPVPQNAKWGLPTAIIV